MCYNDIRAQLAPKLGQIAKSKMGHDTGRLYAVIAVLNPEFVLVCDGRLRGVDKPKQKRFRHLRVISESSELAIKLANGKIDNKDILNILQEFKTK